MLNRRTLRIKIMQTLFAFEQCKEANYNMVLDQIDDHFQPDLNSMEVQDKALLKSQQKTAHALFEGKFEKTSTPDDSDATVNKFVKDSISHYHKLVKKDLTFFSKNMVLTVEKVNEYYFSVLSLLVAFAEVAATDKKTEYRNYIGNSWVIAFRDNTELNKNLLKLNAGWSGKMDKVRSWFMEIVRVSPEFKKFTEESTPGLESQKAIIKHIARKLILANGPINSYYDEEDIYWAEDQDIVKSLVDKTIKSLKEDSGTIELQKLSLDWEDDKEFMVQLFDATTDLDEKFKELIARNTKNWEVDRLPLTDRVILEMAIGELITFTHIPVKVTINEYIELAKEYSTPKSRQFINGILDVIAKELSQSGSMKKSGRGLIDNK